MCIQKATEFELLPILFCYPWLGRSCEYFEMPKYDLLVKIQNLCNNWLHLLSPACFFAISWVLLVVPILSGWGWVMENLNLHSSAALREFRSFRCHFWTIHLQCCCCHSCMYWYRITCKFIICIIFLEYHLGLKFFWHTFQDKRINMAIPST